MLFHGRLDNQVKVRGYRIELSEIESVLARGPGDPRGGGRRGRAGGRATALRRWPPTWSRAISRAGIDRNRLLANLGARLPAYMVPAFLDVLESFPTLPSGKVDRKRLPAPLAALVRTDRAMRAPSDALEADLLATYARVLRNDAISIDDDFFLALGGYSLLAAQLVSELRKDSGRRGRDPRRLQPPDDRGAGGAPALQGRGRPRERGAATGRRARPGSTARTRSRRSSRAARALRAAFAGVQALGLYVVYAVMAVPYLGAYFSLGRLARRTRVVRARASACGCWCSPAPGRRCCCSAWRRSGS